MSKSNRIKQGASVAKRKLAKPRFVELSSPTLAIDLTKVFSENVKRARTETRELLEANSGRVNGKK